MLDDQGNWVATTSPEPGTDAGIMAEARRLIANEQPGDARELLDPWIDANARTDNPYLPQAYLLRGDATSAAGDEWEGLYDYESVIKGFPGSPEFTKAVERELEIAIAYLHGLKRKWLGLRFLNAEEEGIELLVRVQERMPGSRLAERAGIELGDHYYRNRELSLASEAYELFLKNYPNSAYRDRALQRRVYASIGRFKGPRYDGSALIDSRVLIRQYMTLYPAGAAEAGLDESLLNRIDDSAGAQLLETAKWYLVRDDAVAARHTLQRLLKKHPQSAAAGVALKMMEDRGWINLNRSAPLGQPSDPTETIEPVAAPVDDPTPEAGAAP